MKEIKLLLTYDYELFFGIKSGTAKHCLYEPTEKLLSLLEMFNAKATFFVDVLYYWKLINNRMNLEANKFKKHVQKLMRRGHDVQLHIHPHWIDAEYNNVERNWIFKYRNYRLHSLSNDDKEFDEKTILGCVTVAKRLLEDIGKEIDGNYKVLAYRAGGWCIQPFAHLAGSLQRAEIFVDSSVLPGRHIESSTHKIDFRNCPQLPFWLFSNNVIKQDNQGKFIEIPVTSAEISNIKKIVGLVLRKLKGLAGNSFGDGVPMQLQTRKRKITRFISMLLNPYKKEGYKYLTCENISAEEMNWIIDEYRKIHENNDRHGHFPVVMVGHPKNLSAASLKELIKLFKKRSIVFYTIKDYVNKYITKNGRSLNNE